MPRPQFLLTALCVIAGCTTAIGPETSPAPAVARATASPTFLSVDSIGDDSATISLIGATSGRLDFTIVDTADGALLHEVDTAVGGAEPMQWRIGGLEPGQAYRLAWRHTAADGEIANGERLLSVLPARDADLPVRFAFGADLGGQNVCRDAQHGYPVFGAIAALEPDFFVALGDMIYADDVCEARGQYGNAQVPRTVGVAASAADVAAHWAYQFADPALARFRATTPWYTTWDDHEVVNDFDPGSVDTRMLGDSQSGMRAYTGGGHEPLHRRIRYGRHLDLFVLDTRSFRAPNAQPDTRPAPKSMLGATQRDWLIDGLTRSDATWKVVASSVPLAIPTGTVGPGIRDGWANGDTDTGFERELLAILGALERAGVRNLLFVSGDVHFATVLRHRAPGNALVFEELVVGPLSAGVYPTDNLDPTLNSQRLFHHGPSRDDPIADFETARHWFNFGLVEIADDGTLLASIVNANGETLFQLERQP